MKATKYTGLLFIVILLYACRGYEDLEKKLIGTYYPCEYKNPVVENADILDLPIIKLMDNHVIVIQYTNRKINGTWRVISNDDMFHIALDCDGHKTDDVFGGLCSAVDSSYANLIFGHQDDYYNPHYSYLQFCKNDTINICEEEIVR